MTSVKELAFKYSRKFTPTLFDSGIGARLPEAYKKFYDEWRNAPAEPVHYIPITGKIWRRNENTGEITRVEDVPLPRKFPKELNDVFTGGETVIQGFVKNNLYGPRIPRFWVPVVYRSVIYSEILDKYLSALVTKRAIELIIKHRGLDTYLLQTKACDLVSLVAVKLKQRILLALSNKNLPYDNEKNLLIYEKYQKYLLPPEEIEWYGLTFTEACRKLKGIEEERAQAEIIPLKHVYRRQLIEQLKNPEEISEETEVSKPKGWLDNIPGIKSLTKTR